MKYGLKHLRKDFPTDQACLEFAFDTLHSRECACGGVYKPVGGRKQFYCTKCRFQIAPLSGTIFHKSDTPLTLWFHALWVFSNAKSGVSAKEMERQLAVTYKTAWRMLSLIRKALKQEGKLSGDVEMDTAYFGGKKNAGKNNEKLSEAMAAKSVVMGAVQRGGDVHANTIEAFWSHIKRSITGTHKGVSKKHLQEYLDAFVFLRNNRHNDKARFFSLLEIVMRGAVA